MFDGYNAYVSIGDELKLAQFTDTVRQVCMSYANNKFVKAADQGGRTDSRTCFKPFNLTPEKRLRERQSLETKELLIVLRSLWIVNCQRIQN